MKISGPIIMQSFSASQHAFEARPEQTPVGVQFGVVAVLTATWSEQHGGKVISKSEKWKLEQPNMWLAT